LKHFILKIINRSQIRFKTLFKNCVLEALRRRGWKETDHEVEWDIYWAEKEWIHEIMDHTHLNNNQRVNHYRNHYEVIENTVEIIN
jgi:tubulin polyglutamylase TTLL9